MVNFKDYIPDPEACHVEIIERYDERGKEGEFGKAKERGLDVRVFGPGFYEGRKKELDDTKIDPRKLLAFRNVESFRLRILVNRVAEEQGLLLSLGGIPEDRIYNLDKKGGLSREDVEAYESILEDPSSWR